MAYLGEGKRKGKAFSVQEAPPSIPTSDPMKSNHQTQDPLAMLSLAEMTIFPVQTTSSTVLKGICKAYQLYTMPHAL